MRDGQARVATRAIKNVLNALLSLSPASNSVLPSALPIYGICSEEDIIQYLVLFRQIFLSFKS